MKSRIINHLNTKHYIHEFRNVNDLYNSATNTKRGKKIINKEITENDKWVFGKYGIDSVDKVVNGVNSDFIVKKQGRKTSRKQKGQKRRKKYSDQGDVDVMRALSGSMSPFIRKTKVKSKCRNVELIVSLTISAKHKTKDIAAFCNEVADKAASLISSGKMVKITLFSYSINTTKGNANLVTLVNLKGYREKIDISRIYSICYPVLYRGLILESYNIVDETLSAGYGIPSQSTQTSKDLLNVIGIDNFEIIDFKEWLRKK